MEPEYKPTPVVVATAAPIAILSDQRSNAVAESLKMVAQKIDSKLLNDKFTDSQAQVIENRGRTIWDIGYQDFRAIMQGVFTALDESVLERSNGWEMAALVYRGVAGLVRDLRQQSSSDLSRDQHSGNRVRERTLQGYVGDFLEEIGLMTWITGQGGLVSRSLIHYIVLAKLIYWYFTFVINIFLPTEFRSCQTLKMKLL